MPLEKEEQPAAKTSRAIAESREIIKNSFSTPEVPGRYHPDNAMRLAAMAGCGPFTVGQRVSRSHPKLSKPGPHGCHPGSYKRLANDAVEFSQPGICLAPWRG